LAADDDLQQRLRRLFHAELEEAVGVLNAGLMRLEEEVAAADAADLVTELFRTAHSVKGAALSAGVDDAVGAARRLEGGLARLRDKPEAVRPDMVPSFLVEVDALAAVATQLGGDSGVREPIAHNDAPPSVPAEQQPPRTAPRTVRVAASAVDALVGQAGELVAAASRADVLARALATDGERHDTTASGRVAAGAPLGRTAAGLARDVARVSAAITAGVERLTLQPFADACSGLDRTVRDLAHAGGKKARLVVEGADVEVDRSVAAMLREPLLHLVRNAVDHGIEPLGQRRTAGKPETGTVTIEASLRQGRLEVVVRDDGRGVDRAGLRRAAEDRRGAEPGTDELALAFAPGVSTRATVSDVSGRGVGLDAVRARIEAVGGAVRMDSTPGEGTTVTLTSPVNLALMRVLLLEVAGETVALPTAAVECLVTVSPDEMQSVSGRAVVSAGDRIWPVRSLPGLFGETVRSGHRLPLALVEAGPSAAALAADALLDEREAVVRPVPARLAGIPELLGVTVLAEGGVALVLNPAACLREGMTPPLAQAAGRAPEVEGRRRVLIAEDTVTTRVLQQHILESAGYEVVTAEDGAEAWALLERHGADVVVSDVNMPRMDGIELCQAIRRSEQLAGIPVVLVTSLGSEEDRRRGVEAGADAYIVKAEFAADLLVATVERLL